MNAVSKKASTKAVDFLVKLTGKPYGLSTSWETVYNIASEKMGLEMDVRTTSLKYGDNTTLTYYKGEEKAGESVLPNADAFDKSAGDWQWNYIYKTAVEWMMGSTKKKTKRASAAITGVEDLRKKKHQLYMKIRYMKGKGQDTKALEKEYSEITKKINKK